MDSSPLTLQTVVIVWSSNIAGNVFTLGDEAVMKAKPVNLARM
jgi:hypothetical protein